MLSRKEQKLAFNPSPPSMSRIVNFLNIGHYLKKKKRFERSSRYVNCVRYPRNIDTRDIRVWRWILFRCNNSWECLFSSIEKEVIWFEKKREGRSVKGYVSSSLVKIFLSLLWSRSIERRSILEIWRFCFVWQYVYTWQTRKNISISSY